jgi:hypothetical protein
MIRSLGSLWELERPYQETTHICDTVGDGRSKV